MSTQDATKREPRQPGSATGKLVIHADDDEHLADFADYVPSRESGLEAVIKLYSAGKISQGKAAELAGLSRAVFIETLTRYQVSPFQSSVEEIAEDVARAE